MIAQFAWRLICGMSLVWALMPRKQVTSGFFRIQMLVVMGLGVLGAMTFSSLGFDSDFLSQQAAASLSGVVAFAGFLGSAFWALERRKGGERIGMVVLAMSMGLVTLTMPPPGRLPYVLPWAKWLMPISSLLESAVLGSTMVGMLLGHWYLTTPTMSIEPLKRVNLFLGIAGLSRLIASTVAVLFFWTDKLSAAKVGSELPEFMSVPLAWLFLRWLAGVFGPIIVSLMVWRILKYRNTQAATGVLFVGVILAFIGDMTAALLLQETMLPL